MIEQSEQALFELEALSDDNPALFAIEANKQAKKRGYPFFVDFVNTHQQTLEKPREPNRVICPDKRPVAQQIYQDAERRIRSDYEQKKRIYEQKKYIQETIRKYPATMAGYGAYVADFYPQAIPFLFCRFKLPVSEAQRRMHTYITGMTGSGKSEALKTLMFHYITRNKYPALVLLTPSKKIAQEVALFPENVTNNRLVYICPTLQAGLYPCLNPFDIPDKQTATEEHIERYAQEFILVFQEILSEKLTNHMANILNKTLSVLLRMENTSIYDLLDFLDPSGERAGVYIEYAQKHLKNPVLLQFFEQSFLSDRAYIITKSSLHARLHLVFGSRVMQGVMIGRRTIDIEKAINEGKLIVFDISKDDLATEWETLGKFVIAYLKIIAFQRADKNPRPCHVFIDECHNYVTDSLETILRESRKYGLHLTLAQQTAGEKMSKDLKTAIFQNTAIKLSGMGAPDSLEIIAKQTGATLESLNSLKRGKFSLWKKALNDEEQRPPLIVTMPTNTLDNHHSMTASEWEAIRMAQIEAFYRVPQAYKQRTEASTQESEKKGNNSEDKTPQFEPDEGSQRGSVADMDLSNYWN